MASPAYDVAELLAAFGFGSFPSDTPWSINVGSEPTIPDQAITIYDTPGIEPDTDELDRRPSFQVRVRSPGYLDGNAKLSAIYQFLINQGPLITNGRRYAAFIAQSDIGSIGMDDNSRYLFVANFRVPLLSGG